MTVYNGEKYIADAVNSIREQQFDDFELVIVDDGSTDATVSIVEGIGDPRIRLIKNPQNVGQTRSLNYALSLAVGEFVARLDADDLSEPNRLSEQVAFLDEHPGVALVGSWYREIDESGDFIKLRTLPVDHVDIRWSLYFFSPFAHSAVMWRREQVAGFVGRYNEQFHIAQDYEFWHRLARRLKVANIPKPLLRYRIHPNAMTARNPTASEEFRTIATKYMAEALNMPNADRAKVSRILQVVSALIFPGEVEYSASEAREAVASIWSLYRHFTDELDLPYRSDRSRALAAHIRSSLKRGARSKIDNGSLSEVVQFTNLYLRELSRRR